MKQTLSLLGRLIFQFDHGSMSGISPSLGLLPAFCLPTVNLLQEFSKIAGLVCGVAIQERSLARMDLTRVIKDDNLPY